MRGRCEGEGEEGARVGTLKGRVRYQTRPDKTRPDLRWACVIQARSYLRQALRDAGDTRRQRLAGRADEGGVGPHSQHLPGGFVLERERERKMEKGREKKRRERERERI